MIRNVSIARVAAVAPLVLAVAIGEITIQVKQRITDWLYGGLSPIVLWHLAWGILAALLFYLVAAVLPKYGGVPLIWGAGIGGVLVLAQSLVYLAHFSSKYFSMNLYFLLQGGFMYYITALMQEN